jgi:hypothetical protein
MEQTTLILIIVTLFLLVVIVGILTLLIFKLFGKDKSFTNPAISKTDDALHPDISKSEFHPEIIERIKGMEKVKPKRAHLFCPNHTEEPGETMCAICDKIYCRSCIKPFKSLHFCKEHLPLIMRFDWEEVITIKTSTHDPEQGVRLYDVKKEIFEIDDLPTYVETHYKINVDQDYIETYLVLFAQKESIQTIREKIKNKV